MRVRDSEYVRGFFEFEVLGSSLEVFQVWEGWERWGERVEVMGREGRRKESVCEGHRGGRKRKCACEQMCVQCFLVPINPRCGTHDS